MVNGYRKIILVPEGYGTVPYYVPVCRFLSALLDYYRS